MTNRSARHIRRASARTAAGAIAMAVAVALIVATALPAAAGSGRTRRAATDTAPTESERTVVATGTARVRGVPDVLTTRLGVTSRGRTVGEALGRNNQASAKVMEVLRDGDVDKRDIQTSNLSIGPVHDDRSSEVTGYQVSNLLSVQLRDLGSAGDLIDRAAEAGGDDVVVQGVSFDFDDASDLITQARAEAVKRARSQAEQLAAAAGVELGEVLTITESSRDDGPVMDALGDAGERSATVAISPGSEELSVTVSVVYRIR